MYVIARLAQPERYYFHPNTETVKILQELLEEEISPSRVRSLLDVLRHTQDIAALRQVLPKLTEN